VRVGGGHRAASAAESPRRTSKAASRRSVCGELIKDFFAARRAYGYLSNTP